MSFKCEVSAVRSLSNASALATGLETGDGTTYFTSVTALHSETATTGIVTIEVSLDGILWSQVTTIDASTSTGSVVFANVSHKKARARVSTALAGGTVTLDLISSQ